MILEPPVWIADILEQHVEDLDVLWMQRSKNAGSPAYSRRAFTRADARILAHLDALVLADDHAQPFLLAAMAAGYGGALTAALSLLLANPKKHAETLLTAFKTAGGPVLEGLAQALAWVPIPALKDPLLAMAKEPPAPQSIAAIGVLAAHNLLRPQDAPLDSLLAHAQPPIRAAAWRAALQLSIPRPPLIYQNAMHDPDAAVRAAALTAAAWAAQKPVLALCRAAAQKPAPPALPLLELFAVLAETQDAPLFINLAKIEALGPARFDIMGRSGFPAVVPLLLAAMKGKNPADAAAAAQAFTCLTHSDPTNGTRVSLAASKDPVEQAFADEVQVPDPAAAEAFWSAQGPSLSALPRITRGMPVDPSIAPMPASLPNLDCRAYLDIHLRHAFHTGAPKRPGDLIAFSLTPA